MAMLSSALRSKKKIAVNYPAASTEVTGFGVREETSSTARDPRAQA